MAEIALKNVSTGLTVNSRYYSVAELKNATLVLGEGGNDDGEQGGEGEQGGDVLNWYDVIQSGLIAVQTRTEEDDNRVYVHIDDTSIRLDNVETATIRYDEESMTYRINISVNAKPLSGYLDLTDGEGYANTTIKVGDYYYYNTDPDRSYQIPSLLNGEVVVNYTWHQYLNNEIETPQNDYPFNITVKYDRTWY